MWKEIKKIISLNNSNHTFPTAIMVNNETLIMKSLIHRTLLMPSINNLFAKVAIDIQSYIRFSRKKNLDYLPPQNIESFFITPADSTEVPSIISSLNQDKSDETNSIPIKVLKLYK